MSRITASALGGIECTRRLVRQQQVPIPPSRPRGDRGRVVGSPPEKLIGKAGGAVGEPELLEGFHAGDAGALRAPDAVELHGQADVLDGAQAGQQIEVLEHIADRTAAAIAPGRCAHIVDTVNPSISTSPARRNLRGFPRSSEGCSSPIPPGPHHRDERARVDREVDAAQRVHLVGAGLRTLGHVSQLERASSPHPRPSTQPRAPRPAPAPPADPPRVERGGRRRASSHRITESSRNSSASDDQQEPDLVLRGVVLQTRPLLHELHGVAPVHLHHVAHVDTGQPQRRPRP